MKKNQLLLAGIAVCLAGSLHAQTISGFSPSHTAEQQKLEKSFDGFMHADSIGNRIKELSSVPHHIGSPGGKKVAEKILAAYRRWGWDAKIETYQVLFPTPVTRVLEMQSPTQYTAILKEPALAADATSGQTAEQLPTYNAWSADGDVTGELVFVNYGLPDDYDMLKRMGIDVKGKIVIAKYGRSWRGTKPKVAQEHGAIGCIIYSDPKDDGYVQGDVYPQGPYKNEFGVQRGSVMDMVIYPGDPLTPDIGATENAQRLDRLKAPNLLKIPVLPISYHDAQPLLSALDGPVAPAEWRGGLPMTYHVGPGKTKVHLKLSFDWKIRPAYDVIATIRGSEFPDEWVVRGNHHDAWVNGANDPISGQAAELEEAKAIGEMVKKGWRPKRTLVYCAWDGEEPGLLGSTEWLEDHMKELQQKAVVYINSDDNGRGFLGVEGSHALTGMVTEISQSVKDPQTGVSVFERAKAMDATRASTPAGQKEALHSKTFEVGAMGSGSDYSAFIQHAGIPSLSIGYGGENGGGEYHSIYDSYDDYRRFKDPGFVYCLALAQTAGRAVLRMADADLLPFNYRTLYTTVNDYVHELIKKTDQMRDATEMENEVIRANSYQLAKDPRQPLAAPEIKPEVPYLDFAPLLNAAAALDKATDNWGMRLKNAAKNASDSVRLNTTLYRAEQELLTKTGLPRRSWYRHTLYAPGFYTGYGVKTMPGVREAIEQRNWTEAQEQIKVVAGAIEKFTRYLLQQIP